MEKKKNCLKKLSNFLEKTVKKKISNERIADEVIRSIKFVSVFLIAFLALSFAVYFMPVQLIEEPIAEATLSYLQVQGFNGTVLEGEPVIIELLNGTRIQVSYLCTGLLELIILVSAIIASLGIAWRKRIFGIVVGIIAAQVFNLLRIFITTDLILKSDSPASIEFVHDFLFRATLFVVIVGIYAAWFYWATGKWKKLQ